MKYITLRHPLSAAITAATLATVSAIAVHADETVIQLDALSVTAEVSADKESDSQSYKGKKSSEASGLSLTAKETPQSVTVFSRQRLEDQKLDSVNDVLAQTAGISVKEYDSARQYYYSRGFEVNTIMIDGVPTLFAPGWGTGENASNTALYEQVEIIKGSTGLTSGSGNPSAAVNLVRKRADNPELDGSAEVTIGSRNELNGSVDVGSALNSNGSVRGRAVVAHQQQDSFRSVGDSEQNIIYVTTEADLTDTTLLTLGASVQENINNAPTWGGIPAWYSDGTRTDYSRSKTTAADWAYWNNTHRSFFAELRQALSDDWELNARLTHGNSSSQSKLLYVYGNPDKDTGAGIYPWTGGKFSSDTSYTMADLFVNGSYTLFGREHQASVGLSRSVRDFKALSANATYAEPIDDFNAWDGTDYPEHIWDESFLYEEYTDTQTAVYGSTRLQLSDKLSAILGARITNQEIDREEAAYNAATVTDYDAIFTPYAGLLYDFTDVYTGYVSYTEIFSPQEERDSNGGLLDPVTGKSVEMGIKAGFNDDRLIATAAVFRTLQDSLAVEDGTNTVSGSTDQAYRESEGATSRGYELELSGAITDNWEAQLGWTAYEVKDADGEKVNTEQPRRIFKSYTRYQLPGAFNKVTVGGGINWEGRSYANVTNPVTAAADKVEQEAFFLVSLMAKYEFSDAFSTQLNLDNVTDETYYTNIGTFGQIAYGSPRTVSLSAKYNF